MKEEKLRRTSSIGVVGACSLLVLVMGAASASAQTQTAQSAMVAAARRAPARKQPRDAGARSRGVLISGVETAYSQATATGSGTSAVGATPPPTPEDPPVTGLRSSDPAIVALIEKARNGSQTFLRLSEWTLATDQQTQPFPRVRGASPVVSDAIELASQRSPTFLHLVTTINGTDGIVYVHLGQCGRQVLSCLLLAITQAGSNRLLHIKVDPRRKGNHLMVSIAHELTHAIEVLSEPAVVDGNSAHNFFQRVAPTDRDRYSFETQAAIETELIVDKELREWSRRRRLAERDR